jgi:HlyD family secretion protein
MNGTTTATRRRTLWLVAGVVVLALIVLVVRVMSHSAPEIRVAQVMRGNLLATTSTNGVVEPVSDFQVHSPVAALVKSVYVHEGELVPKGKLMLTLDDSGARAALTQAAAALKAAQANLQSVQHGGNQEEQLTLKNQTAQAAAEQQHAQQNLDAIKKLAAQGAASPAEVQAAQQRLDNANGALGLAQQRKTDRYAPLDVQHTQALLTDAHAEYAAAAETVTQANVRAPFAGTVFSLGVLATDYVTIGQKLLELADLSHLQVRAYFDEPEIGKLALGQQVIMVWAAKPNRTWHGHIARMPATVVHYGTRNVGEVLITVDDPDGVLLPATNVTVTVTTTEKDGVLLMPREALRLGEGQSGSYVYVVRGRRIHKQVVQVGAVNLIQAEVTSGLKEGDVVALGSASGVALRNGMEINVAP